MRHACPTTVRPWTQTQGPFHLPQSVSMATKYNLTTLGVHHLVTTYDIRFSSKLAQVNVFLKTTFNVYRWNIFALHSSFPSPGSQTKYTTSCNFCIEFRLKQLVMLISHFVTKGSLSTHQYNDSTDNNFKKGQRY